MPFNTTGFLGNPFLKPAGYQHEYTKEQIAEYIKCANDPIYFITHYVYIINLDKGRMLFSLWDFQKEMVDTFLNNRFVICKIPRQSGKSQTAVAFFLHQILFNQDYSIAILAHKGDLAKDLLARLKFAYENLPKWLQQGVLTWNKFSIELENGSKVVASTTSASGIRGQSYSLVFLDEFAHVQHNLQEDFFKSTYPTISSGKTTKLFIVSTPKGLNLFYKIWTEATEKKNYYVPIDVHWSRIPGRDEKWKQETIANTSIEQFNQEFNTEFLGSSNTLINASKLKMLAAKSPIHSRDGFDLYIKPQEKHIYTVIVDVSHGLNQDYSVAQVIDITQAPYRLVAKYRSSDITPLLLPNIIYKIAKDYNDADVLIEVNDIGQQVADILHYELEYPNILTTTVKGRKGQMVSGGFSKNIQWGVKTTAPVKRIGCINLKDLIESDKLIVEDMDTIMEFSTFVEKGNSYEAEPGTHDDMVMPLVLFAWLTSQRMFKEITDMDIRTKMHDDLLKSIEEEMLPFGFINDGLNEGEIVDNEGCMWTVV